jgi:hypothetical protein
MPIKLPVTITHLEDKNYMAHCDLVRATATGNIYYSRPSWFFDLV